MKKFESTIKEICDYILDQKAGGKRIFLTSSFQTQSAVFLHILSQIDKSLPIYFLNTGYHFSETVEYKIRLTALLDLNVLDPRPLMPKLQQKNIKEELLYASDPDLCCYYNKVQPLENVLSQYDI